MKLSNLETVRDLVGRYKQACDLRDYAERSTSMTVICYIGNYEQDRVVLVDRDTVPGDQGLMEHIRGHCRMKVRHLEERLTELGVVLDD